MKLRIIILSLLAILNFNGCENTSKSIEDPYIDPHIIFSSRRWWNYDIYITDIYSSSMSHITKNKYIDFNPAISPNSKKLAFVSDRDGNREIYIADLEWLDGYARWAARNLSNITNSTENEWTPTFSPVENIIAFSTYFPQNDNYDIFIMDFDGGYKINLTNTDSYEKFLQFSLDGSFIIYQGWAKGKMEIFFTNLFDKNRVNLTRNPLFNDIISHGNCFSENSQKIVFTSDRDGNRNIYLMNSDGSDQEKITYHESDDYEPVFSSDGSTIIFTSERDGNKEIYSYDIESKKISNLTRNKGDDWNARFYSDSEKLIFQSTRDANWEIYRMSLDGSNQVNLTNHPSTDYSYVVLPLLNP